jgi:hypothetical protein
MSGASQAIAEYHDVDDATFRRDIATAYRPAVLRGFVSGWPAVREALKAPEAVCDYLAAFDNGAAVDVIRTPPSAKGRIFYNEHLNGFNFTRDRAPISSVLGRLAKYATQQNPPAVVVQSALIADCIPGFAKENRLTALPDSVSPRVWLGSAVVTPAHFDESNNVACVVAGRRRFTLFPPAQIANLYIGPLGYAPTGTPISLVSFRDPDFKRYPRFREALAAAQVAELVPGDAIFIPALWWHHVESLEKYNALVNYWWKGPIGAATQDDSAFDPLIHCLLNLKHLSAEQRQAWGLIFDYYLFGAGDDLAAHIPEHKRGVLGEISPELAKQIKAFLVEQLKR